MRRDGFVRCYLEAWAYWIGLNLLGAAIDAVTDGRLRLPGISFLQLDRLFDPLFLAAQGLLLIPAFAGMLVGIRRPTGRAD